MKYEYVDLGEQYRRIRTQMDAAILGAVEEGAYISGPQVEELEKALADYVGVEHCISVANGTDALLMCLMASGIGPGDGVLTSPFSFFATAEVISLVGATPIFCDINPDSYNLDPFCLEQTIKRQLAASAPLRLRAVMPVDLYGLPADYNAIEGICQSYDLELIEDAAQGFGGSYHGKKLGGFGRYGCTSFFPAKPLGCYGDGGAIFTNSREDAELLRSIRVHGKGESKYDNRRIGLNARLDTLQAAVLLEKLKVFDWELQERERVAAGYNTHLAGRVKTPAIPAGLRSCYAQYTIALPSQAVRDGLQKGLVERGIPTNIYYPIPIHRQRAYQNLPQVGMPNAEWASQTVLSLPMHPYLSDGAVADIAGNLLEVLETVSPQ